MQEKSILTDCLESLKHAAERYQQAAFECDHSHVRDVLQNISIDRLEQQAAVFKLMHQMGLYETPPAPGKRLEEVVSRYRDEVQAMHRRHKEVEGAHALPLKER